MVLVPKKDDSIAALQKQNGALTLVSGKEVFTFKKSV